jgi:FtsH-binding integral membrane protein
MISSIKQTIILPKLFVNKNRSRLFSNTQFLFNMKNHNIITKHISNNHISIKHSTINNNDLELQEHAKNVAFTTGKLLGTTALTGTAAVGIGLTLLSANIPYDILMPLGITTYIGSFCGSLYNAWKIDDPNKTEAQKLKHAYWMNGFMGVVISPSLLVFHQVIPHALITTSALVAGPIVAAKMMPSNSLLSYGPALSTALCGLIGVGFTSIIAPLIGFHDLGIALHSIDLYGGVILFTIYNAYDTQVVIDEFNKGNRDIVKHSAIYSLNVINIFIRLLEIFSKIQKKN